MLALKPSFLATAALLTSFLPAVIAADDYCPFFRDRTFRIYAMSKYNDPKGGERYQAVIEINYDPATKISGPEVSSCTLGYLGKGCKWQKTDNSSMPRDHFVQHDTYSAYNADADDIQITGANCPNQVRKCAAKLGTIADPGSGTIFVSSRTKCGSTAPDVGIYTPEDLQEFNNLANAYQWCGEGNECNLVLEQGNPSK